jgi:outer membrane lipopolysaccharide assembly protein LptE/RlpB
VLALLTGCGVYSFSGSGLTGIRSVAVPQFENRTVEYGIQEDLTAAVIDQLIADNTLKVVALADADAVLRGEIIDYKRVAYTYDKSDNVQEYKVNITVSFALEKKDGKVVLNRNGLLDYGIYSASDESEIEGKARAVDKLARDIVDETTKSW